MAIRSEERTNICEGCGKEFHPWKSNLDGKFCSKPCRKVRCAFTCDTCGKSFEVKASQAEKYNVRYCSKQCMYKKQSEERRGAGTPWYKGGYIASGYRVITVDRKKHLEHRYIMEQHLGRELTRAEDVHHRDGDKLNNDIDNLRVMSKKDHTRLHFDLLEATGYWNGRSE